MNIQMTTGTPTPVVGFHEPIFRFIRSVTHAIRVGIACRQTENALSALSPRQLADIGLEGADLGRLAYEMAARSTR